MVYAGGMNPEGWTSYRIRYGADGIQYADWMGECSVSVFDGGRFPFPAMIDWCVLLD